MALTLVTNPVGSGTSKVFAGFRPVEFVFKREDLAVISTESGTGGVKINHAGDLSSYLNEGDTIYLYSEGTGYTYDGTGEIIEITAGEITIDMPYIVNGTGGYINYFKNYYVELQCVHITLSDVNLLPFSLQSDGDPAGNISIDVSIVNDLNRQRGAIVEGLASESVQEFEVKYRQVYEGSSESFTLVDNKLIILLYTLDEPETEVILNSFDIPCLYLGYPAALAMVNLADVASSEIELTYRELDINQNEITTGTLGLLDSDVNGPLIWEWPDDISLNDATYYVDFNFEVTATFDFAATDFGHPDFLVQ